MLQNNYARKEFAEYLRLIRLTLHLSIKDTAELIGIFPSRLSDYEKTKHIPTANTLHKMTTAFKSLGVSKDNIDQLTQKHNQAINSSNNRVIGRIRGEMG